MERQMARTAGDAGDEVSSPDVETSKSDAREPSQQVWIAQLKHLYESGTTLDELCRREKIGKVALSALLREAGTAMRRPGRRSWANQVRARHAGQGPGALR
jgi:hypothetical protein